mmetsp:Transcript_74142/g.192585  ORF Transcript_74142/g.192585 Transcript_74142/m.192585 type:complete len:241 (+) Transcript_74142:781-1503(+)
MACRKEECTLLSASKAAEATIQSCALALLAMPPGKSTSITKSAYTYASAAANVVVDEAFVADASAVLFGGVLVVVDPVIVVVLEPPRDEIKDAAGAVLVPSVFEIHFDNLLVVKIAVLFFKAAVQVVLVNPVAVRFLDARARVCEEVGGAVVAMFVQPVVGTQVDKLLVLKVVVLFIRGDVVEEPLVMSLQGEVALGAEVNMGGIVNVLFVVNVAVVVVLARVSAEVVLDDVLAVSLWSA